jgi:hypothetical protein
MAMRTDRQAPEPQSPLLFCLKLRPQIGILESSRQLTRENYILIDAVLIQGVEMRFGIIMCAILVVTVCFSPTLAMSARVYSLSEGNLSIDLGPGFEIG